MSRTHHHASSKQALSLREHNDATFFRRFTHHTVCPFECFFSGLTTRIASLSGRIPLDGRPSRPPDSIGADLGRK